MCSQLTHCRSLPTRPPRPKRTTRPVGSSPACRGRARSPCVARPGVGVVAPATLFSHAPRHPPSAEGHRRAARSRQGSRHRDRRRSRACSSGSTSPEVCRVAPPRRRAPASARRGSRTSRSTFVAVGRRSTSRPARLMTATPLNSTPHADGLPVPYDVTVDRAGWRSPRQHHDLVSLRAEVVCDTTTKHCGPTGKDDLHEPQAYEPSLSGNEIRTRAPRDPVRSGRRRVAARKGAWSSAVDHSGAPRSRRRAFP